VEQFGFRLRDGRVQARYGGDTPGCGAGYWQSLTDPAVEIAELQFRRHAVCTNLSDPGAACREDAPRLIRRAVQLRLLGHRRDQPDAPVTLSRWVRLRNDRLAGAGR
jgi:hypothetical protein